MDLCSSEPPDIPDALGHASLNRHHSDSQRQHDPSWLYAPGLLSNPGLKARFRQPRKQLDPYSLYISSHVELEGPYTEPSPSPSPSPVQSRSSSPVDWKERDILHANPSVETFGILTHQVASPESLPITDTDTMAHGVELCHKHGLTVDLDMIQASVETIDANDQLPTPRSLSRSSTLVDDSNRSDKGFSSQEQKETKLRARKRRRIVRHPKRDGASRLSKTDNSHSMTTRSKSRAHRKGLV